MKRALLIVVLVLVAAGSSLAAGMPASLDLSELHADARLNTTPLQVARAVPDHALHQALELPPSEMFEQPAQAMLEPDGPNEFELKLPEEGLPDADIPLTLNGKVDYFIRYFQTVGRSSFSRWLSRSERYIPMMKEVLRKEGLPEDLVYLAMIESGFTPHAVSWANAVGPWQFISGTGKRYALRIDQWIDERRDPLKSSVAAALYLKELYSLFNNDWYLAAAGYNAGENKILRAIGKYNTRDFWEISKGSYLKRETKEYVPKLLAAAIIAKEPAKYGFADIAYLPPIEFDSVTIPSRTDLEVVARLAGINYDDLRELNPELRRWCTPPNYPGYQLKVPKGSAARFEAEYANLPEDQRFQERISYARYKVKRKESLATVAKRFNTTAEVLTELNQLKANASLRGRTLVVPVQIATTPDQADRSSERLTRKSASVFNKYYTVKRGDTLVSVSKQFNVSTKVLAAWNNLKGKMALKPGRRIVVAKFTEKKDGALVAVHEKS